MCANCPYRGRIARPFVRPCITLILFTKACKPQSDLSMHTFSHHQNTTSSARASKFPRPRIHFRLSAVARFDPLVAIAGRHHASSLQPPSLPSIHDLDIHMRNVMPRFFPPHSQFQSLCVPSTLTNPFLLQSTRLTTTCTHH